MKEGGGIAAHFHSLLCCDLWQGSLVWGEGKTEVLEPKTRQPEVVQGNAWEERIKDVQNMIFMHNKGLFSPVYIYTCIAAVEHVYTTHD